MKNFNVQPITKNSLLGHWSSGGFTTVIKKSLLSLLLVATISSLSFGQLFNSGPIVNGVGTGAGGADESILQTISLGMNTLGFGHQVGFGNTIADDFTIPAGETWQINDVILYAYQTGSTTASTITEVRIRIWDGVPGGGGTVIFGDLTNNLLNNTIWSNTYRVTEATTGTSTVRPIMENTATINTQLTGGTYWLEWQANGTLGSGPWAPPITITGTASTGNGLQSLDNGVTFNPANDSGTGSPQQGFPFILLGNLVADGDPCELDVTPPTITCPTSLTNLDCLSGPIPVANTIDEFLALPGASASDDFSTVDELTISFGDSPGSFDGLNLCSANAADRTITRTYMIADACGNQSECIQTCLLYTSPSPRDATLSRMPSSA